MYAALPRCVSLFNPDVVRFARFRFRYKRRPTAETLVAAFLLVAGLSIATLIFTGREPVPPSLDSAPGLWKSQISHSTANLLDVTFVDSNNGWIVGSNGTILHTSDGGNVWERQNSNENIEFARVVFVDAAEGWAVGKLGIILHTSDGGNTWTRQGDEFTTLRLNLIALAFPDRLNGWAFTESGSFMLTTNDGGETWNREFLGYTSNRSDAFFANTQNGWIIQSGGGLTHTSDGGSTWDSEPGIAERGISVRASRVFFLDDDHGWIAGSRSKGSSVEFTKFLSDGMVAFTTDGGRTWTRRDSGTGRFLWDVEFVNALEGWAVGSKGTILYSNDGGETWIPQFSGINNILRAIDFSDENNGWAVGNDGSILRYERR